MKRTAALLLLVSCHASPSTQPESDPFSIGAGSIHVRFGARANAPLRVERSPGAYLEITAVGARDVVGRREVDGRVIYDLAFPSTRVVHVTSDGRTEEIRHVERKAVDLAYRIRLGPSLERLRVVEDYVEALDARGVALLRSEPASLVDAAGRRRDLAPRLERDGDAWSLVYRVDDSGLEYPLEIDPAWTATTQLIKARRDNTTVLLSSGKVVTVAGLGTTTTLSSVESWDPATSSWTSAGFINHARDYHAGTLLSDGRILLGGGTGADADTTAEIYDPATATSTDVKNGAPWSIGTYGRIVQVSPTQALFAVDDASMLLDIPTGTWTDTPYVENRASPTIAKLPSGKVLLAGGGIGPFGSTPLSTCEVFDLATKKWTNVASMKVARGRGEAVLLPSGKVLVAGGYATSTAELYDPVANTWTLTPPMSGGHSFNTMLLLAGGKVIDMGGDLASGITDRTDLYDPATNTWTYAGKLLQPIDEFGAVALPSGKAMIVGGSNGAPLRSVQIFDFLAKGAPCVGDGACTSGFCVDGVCCEKGACAAGETCGGSGAAGVCAKKDGASCASNAECGSVHCVDGVCCDSACDDICGACNLAGNVGKCVAVAAGDAPHGSRGTCPGTGVCRARCSGVDKSACTQFPGTAVSCAPAACVAGAETHASGCDGKGGCAAPAARDCAPYVCGAAACKIQCDADADCVPGNTCDLVTRKCVIAATCDSDHAVKSPDGKVKDCAPFRCTDGRCLDACTESSSCADGYVCDTAASRCIRGVSDAGDSGGCSVGRTGESWPWTIALLALLSRRRRAR